MLKGDKQFSEKNSAPRNQRPPWIFIDSGALSGRENMEIDEESLGRFQQDDPHAPCLRFFRWKEKTITFGYLMDEAAVQAWALENGLASFPTVRRPTAGGIVIHEPTDLSLSLIWKRGCAILPEKPRSTYEAIHKILKQALEPFLSNHVLYVKPVGSCASPTTNSLSVCFRDPVCNDIMIDGKKMVGGALRITKKTILYQGHMIQVPNIFLLKKNIRSFLERQNTAVKQER